MQKQYIDLQLKKQSIRQQINAQRRALTSQQLILSSQQLAKQSLNCRALHKAQRIATYNAAQGEIDPKYISHLFSKAAFYTPKIINYPHRIMRFVEASTNAISQNNRYGIKEAPSSAAYFNAKHLDIILLPLVAFDLKGNRLGMGGGFYDRILEFKTRENSFSRPKLIGLAHDFQQVDHIIRQPWDIPLDAILTNQQLINCRL